MYKSCPCCTFRTKDLFLPDSNPSKIKDEQENNAKNESTTINSFSIQEFPSPLESLKQLSTIPLVDTHGHAHLQRHPPPNNKDDHPETIYYVSNNNNKNSNNAPPLISLTCAVAPSDWNDCLQYAAQYKYRRAAIGVHPWYLDEILIHDDSKETNESIVKNPKEFNNNNNDNSSSSNHKSSTTSQRFHETWLSDMETLLQQHPGCLVGEIGLCKVARFVRTYPGGKTMALALQRQVVEQQLILAAHYQRPVSIHCVQQHGVLLDIFRTLASSSSSSSSMTTSTTTTTTTQKPPRPQSRLPPAIALHSFSGTAQQVQQLLKWEEEELQQDTTTTTTPLLYFGFSHSVNYGMCTSAKAKQQTQQAIRQVPMNRLLVESDVQDDHTVAAGTAGSIAFVAFVLQKSIVEVAQQTQQNGLRFLSMLPCE